MKYFLLFLLIFNFVLTDGCDSTNNDNCFPEGIEYKRFQYGNHTINRPIFHFTPKEGWMNDPNGLFYDGTNYHIYFQYNPANNIWELPLYWGHAVFKNGFTSWDHKPIAIQPTDKLSGAYSGSIYIDDGDLSKQFSSNVSNPNHRIIAMWTMTYANWIEHQFLSLSFDGGDTFVTPKTVQYNNANINVNPVVDIPKEGEGQSKQFRDPQVIKYSSSLYIMSVAKSHEYAIYFYSSSNALQFSYAGKFEMAGYLGFQYECPNLAYLNNTDKATGSTEDAAYWVLFISINPGSQQGGSSTEYFIGQIITDEETTGTGEDAVTKTTISFKFIDNGYTTLLDLGKDFYAMQIFYKPPSSSGSDGVYSPSNSVTGIAWASNWQYTALVPTDPWRSSMSLPREIKIAHYSIAAKKLLYIFSRPCIKLSELDTSGWKTKETNDGKIESGYTLDLSDGAFGALEFEFEFTVVDSFTNDDPGVITLYLYGLSIPEEYLRIGYNQKADAFFIDRGHTNVQFVHDNPFFTDKLSINVYGKVLEENIPIVKKRSSLIDETKIVYTSTMTDEGSRVQFKVHGIIDRNIIELFFNEEKDDENDEFGWSPLSSTNTFFFTGGNFIGNLKVEYNAPSLVNGNVITANEGFDNVKLRARQLYQKSE